MKILHTADWHIGNFMGPEKEGKNLRAIDTGNCLNHMELIAMCEKPDIMVVSGDVFHQAHVWSDRGLEETGQAIQAIEAFSCICPVIALRGTPNHDGEGQFEILKRHFDKYKNVFIVTEPTVIEVNTFGSEPLQVAALPGFDKGVFRAKFPGISREDENQIFTEELGNIVLGLKAKCSNDIPSILITHYTVPGCNTESGQTQFWSKAEPIIEPNILNTANFNLVALGHIHRPQQLEVCSNTFYSGAINALNFNDEGQDRGFYIHDINRCSGEWVRTNSKFYNTPSREFITIKLFDEDTVEINNGEIDLTATRLWIRSDSVKDKIVRVIYSCNDTNNKAFNKSLLEKRLYLDGAFWVSEIIPTATIIEVNRDLLSEENSPEANLINYLNEKGLTGERINDVLELARPIINEAVAGNITTVLTGLFVPVEIQVKNYRNYKEETFNYENINFCTINGKNGVGKSSLFMDAILDCIYEEPREGDLTGWISNDDKARSGSISFTFKVGDKLYRIVRTRAKSGKATLNLSESIEGEWVNRSKEKIRDTQDDIINLVGMDSLTFKSCALIMQDQYGLFLQADKESRMSILANILGLKIYDIMENVARDKSTNLNRSIREHNNRIEKLTETMSNKDSIKSKIIEIKAIINNKTTENKELHKQADLIKLRLNTKLEAVERVKKINESINTLEAKKASVEAETAKQKDIVSKSEAILFQEAEIIVGVNTYFSLLEEEKVLLKGKALYDSKVSEYETTVLEMTRATEEINKLISEKSCLDIKIKELKDRTVNEDMLKEKAEEYEVEKNNLAVLEEKAEKYVSILNEIASVENKKSELKSIFDKECAERTAEIKSLKSKVELLDNSGCIDKGNAKCKFLNDANEAQSKLLPYIKSCTEWKEEKLAKIGELEKLINSYRDTQNELDYSIDVIKEKRNKVEILEIQAKLYSTVRLYKEQINILNERFKTVTEDIFEFDGRLKKVITKKGLLNTEVEEMKSSAEKFNIVQEKILASKKWIDLEKLILISQHKTGQNHVEQQIKQYIKNDL